MKQYQRLAAGSIAGGVMIGIGGSVYLSCANAYVGAVFFCVALLSICALGLKLYTGAIGYLALPSRLAKPYVAYPLILSGNLAGVLLCAAAVKLGGLTIGVRAAEICAQKLKKTPVQALFLAVLCGILMYVAVEVWRSAGSALGILFCVPVFILSGFEHSVADAFYFAAAGMLWEGGSVPLFLLMAVVGNSLGAMLIAGLHHLTAGGGI